MYLFYLGDMMLPVTPEKLELKIANNNKTITLINEGEVNLLKRPGLTKITFGALLPNTRYPFAVYKDGFQSAETYLNKLESLKNSLAPFVFRVMRSDDEEASSFDTFFTAALEDYSITEDAEKYGRDVYVSISLLQYKGYVTKTITFQDSASSSGTKAATVSAPRDTSTKTAEKTYTVQSGDSLWGIAKKQLGNGSKYAEIYALNKDAIEAAAKKNGRASSSNGRWIYPGTVLKLPQ